MQRLRMTLAVAAALLALATLPRTSPAAGTIDVTNATVAAGTAPAQGVVTIDDAAPSVDPPALPTNAPLGLLGAMPGSIPAFVGGATGANIVIGPATAPMAGGTYNCGTYTVTQGGMAVYGGQVTIISTGDVTIDGGVITTTAAGAGISIVCGGNLLIKSRTGAFTTGISTTGANSPVSVDVAGTVTSNSADGSGSWINAVSGQVNVLAHATPALMSLQNITVISGGGGDAVVQSASALSLISAFVQANGGSATAQAFGGPAVLSTGAVIGANNALLEASGPVSMGTVSTVAGANLVGVTAYGGDVTVTSSNITQSGGTGDVTVRARDSLSVGATTSVTNTGTGVVSLTAFGGTARVEQAGASTASTVRAFLAGDASVLASGDVIVAGASLVRSDQGAVRLRSTGGSVSLIGDSQLAAPTGAVDLRASQGFAAEQDATALPGVYPAIDGASLLVGAGTGGISLVVDPVTTQSGGIELVASGDVQVASNLTANGPLTIVSTASDVEIIGRTLVTGPAGGKSGDLTIASFGGSAATIDVSTSSVRSGDHATASGDVTIEIHAPAVAPSVDGALVPGKITVKPVKGSTDRRLVASGVIDFGGNSVTLLGVAQLNVGNRSFPFILGTDSRGRGVYTSDAMSLRITPSKLGTSRAAFTLSVVGDLSGFLDDDRSGTVDIRFERGTFTARGSAEVTGGKFVLGAKRATLIEPGFRVAKAHGVVKDGANDKLDLTLGVGGTDDAPATIPDVTIGFGPTYSVTVPASAFAQTSAGVFVAKDPSQGVKVLVVDFAHETVTFKGRKIELGDLGPDPTVALTCTLTLGTDTRTFTLRMAHNGSALVY